jgi:hypothetical protein
MQRLAVSFGYSSVWLAKLCKEMRVPVPTRGYWAKKKAGRRAPKRGLPKSADPNEELFEIRDNDFDPAAVTAAPSTKYDEDIAAKLDALVVPAVGGSEEHPLLGALRKHRRRVRREQSQQPWAGQARREVDDPPLAISVTRDLEERAAVVFSRLLRAIEVNGFELTQVQERSESRGWGNAGRSKLRVEILGGAYGFGIAEIWHQVRVEKPPDHQGYWWGPKVKLEATGVLSLEMFDEHGSHLRSWRDLDSGKIEDRLERVLRDIVRGVQTDRNKKEEDRVREEAREAERREEQRREDERQRREYERRCEEKRVDLLMQAAERHRQAQDLRRLVFALRHDGPQTDADEEWLRWAERALEAVDPVRGGVGLLRMKVEKDAQEHARHGG